MLLANSGIVNFVFSLVVYCLIWAIESFCVAGGRTIVVIAIVFRSCMIAGIFYSIISIAKKYRGDRHILEFVSFLIRIPMIFCVIELMQIILLFA